MRRLPHGHQPRRAGPQTHDSFRGVPGTFDRAIFALRHARNIGFETQVQTTVTRRNRNRLAQVAERFAEVHARVWSLFFLVVTGRALADDDLTAEEYERVFEFMYGISKIAPFELKTTEAMHCRRYVAQCQKAEHGSAPEAPSTRMVWRTAGVSDGSGFVFISHTGEIFPSGFLPVSAGNVLRDSLVQVYRDSSLFRILRDTGAREGKCGACEYQKICGGSRSRAHGQLSGRRSTLRVRALARRWRLSSSRRDSREAADGRRRRWFHHF